MLRKIIRNVLLIGFCLYSSFFWIGATLAPILAHFEQYDLSGILTALYMFSCHQQPDRSFWLFGYPVALCCRCYGFYLGVTISSVIALFDKLIIKRRWIVILSAVTIIDIFINYGLGVRLNTGNITRFIVGLIMGLLFTVFLCYITSKLWRREDEF